MPELSSGIYGLRVMGCGLCRWSSGFCCRSWRITPQRLHGPRKQDEQEDDRRLQCPRRNTWPKTLPPRQYRPCRQASNDRLPTRQQKIREPRRLLKACKVPRQRLPPRRKQPKRRKRHEASRTRLPIRHQLQEEGSEANDRKLQWLSTPQPTCNGM